MQKNEDFKDYIFSKKELEKKTGKKWNSKQLQETVDGLFDKPIRIREDENKWERFHWFSYFKYDNGTIFNSYFSLNFISIFTKIAHVQFFL